MIVADFIAWLQKQDQDATVEVLVEERDGYGYSGSATNWVEFDPEHHFQYIDLRGNPLVKDGAPYKDRRFLQLGVS